MSIYTFNKRLKCMLNEERAMDAMEAKIAQKAVSYFNHIAKLKTESKKCEKSLTQCKKKITMLCERKKHLEKIIDEENVCLAQLKEEIHRIENEYDRQYKEHIHGKHNMSMKRGLLRFFKDATKMYINAELWPNVVQGVTLCNNEWKPLCVNNYSSPYTDNWRTLILKDNDEQSPADNEK